MSRYRKIDQRIWNDAKFRALGDEAKLVFFMLLTHPSVTMLGAMRATTAGLAEELGWKTEAFRKAFEEVLSKRMVEHDPDAHLIALPNFLKYNKPESPNVVKSWSSALDLLPECNLKTRVVARSKVYAKSMSEAFAEALPEVFAKTMPNQEQEQEQEQDQEKEEPTGSVGKVASLLCRTQAVIDAYHEKLPELPRVKVLSDDRRKAVSKLWKFALTSKKTDGTLRATNVEEAIAWIGGYFERARDNDFVMGRTGRSGEHASWQASIDYLCSERGILQVLEKTARAAA
ncbi:hypothetical protein QN397_12595 [Variovorax sp. RTB1]|uniref:hypothetical protein n=1 Tax=Variovorax sp. RTB1 TaxID=3048631 RepID=UPI002B22C16B|nr:hypothetical protein [Variovorax sp. RTB1]MEB0112192.1 hypothetical protein [Variovorax sp. RTB1]